MSHIQALYLTLNDRKISRLSTHVCFIDMQKAFDTVNRTLLWHKLRAFEIHGSFLTAISSLYTDVKYTVFDMWTRGVTTQVISRIR